MLRLWLVLTTAWFVRCRIWLRRIERTVWIGRICVWERTTRLEADPWLSVSEEKAYLRSDHKNDPACDFWHKGGGDHRERRSLNSIGLFLPPLFVLTAALAGRFCMPGPCGFQPFASSPN